MILVGRLEGTVDGQPVSIVADERGVVVEFSRLLSAWKMRRFAGAGTSALHALRRHGIGVRARLGWLGMVELLPQPSLLARIVSPSLRGLR